MKTAKKILPYLIASSLAFMGAAAYGADSQILTVNAQVLATCKFVSSPKTIDFGKLDPSTTSPVSMMIEVLYKCTKDMLSPGISVADGSARKMKTEAQEIKYTLTVDPLESTTGKGFGPGTELRAKLTASIAVADFHNAKVGVKPYSETITLSIEQ